MGERKASSSAPSGLNPVPCRDTRVDLFHRGKPRDQSPPCCSAGTNRVRTLRPPERGHVHDPTPSKSLGGRRHCGAHHRRDPCLCPRRVHLCECRRGALELLRGSCHDHCSQARSRNVRCSAAGSEATGAAHSRGRKAPRRRAPTWAHERPIHAASHHPDSGPRESPHLHPEDRPWPRGPPSQARGLLR